jgi:hypothetical protein
MSEATIDFARIIAGWNGSSSQSVFIKIFNNDTNFGGNDGLAVCQANTTNCTAPGTGSDNILGRINLGATNYTSGASSFNATLSWNSGTKQFTVAIGSLVSGSTPSTGSSSTATFTPINGASQAGGIRDLAGNGVTGSPTESGVRHF